jgi:hypothetical protein
VANEIVPNENQQKRVKDVKQDSGLVERLKIV